MMRTRQLVVICLLALAVDLWAHQSDPRREALDPVLPAFDPVEVQEVVLTSSAGTLRIARGDTGWDVVHPFTHDAEDPLVDDLISTLSRGVAPEIRADDGDHERYGLVADRQILVELMGEGHRIGALYIGENAGGGQSFVRAPDRETVYRARVGGRSRYARDPGAWRDRRVFSFQPASIIAIRIDHQGETTVLERGDGSWATEGLDASLIARLPETLSDLRAQRILAPGTVADLPSRITLTRDAGPPIVFDVVTEGEIGVLRTRADGPQYQVPAALTTLLAGGREAFLERSLIALDLSEVDTLTLIEPERTSIIRRDRRSEAWVPVQPASLDIDPRRAMDAARYLANFRVLDFVDITPAAAGFPGTLSMQIGDETVEFGADGPPRGALKTRYVRTTSRPGRIGLVDTRVVAALQTAWAR